jgi:predicted flap endonuclease-1-like 5' DNA nuclease
VAGGHPPPPGGARGPRRRHLRRADAGDTREQVARDRADASDTRQDSADASDAREVTATSRVDAIEALATKDSLRIDDLEAYVDIDPQMILELHEAGVLRQDQVEELQTALRTSRMIGQAIGIIMTRRFVTQGEAFTLLRRASNNTNRKLREIAEDIVVTGDAAALV